MAQEFAERFYKSHAWQACRASYLITPIESPCGIVPPGVCERCFSYGELSIAKVVHHKTHLTPQNIDDPAVTLSFDNLERLCQLCHAFVHSDVTDPRVVFVNGRAKLARDESLEAVVDRLLETESDRRNIHRRSDG